MPPPVCSQGSFYFENKFWNELLHLVNAFKATRLFHPGKVVDLHPDATTVLDLKAFHFLQEAIPNLQKELPTYLAAAEDVPVDVEVMEWWQKQNELPNWKAASQQVVLCQPSSATVE